MKANTIGNFFDDGFNSNELSNWTPNDPNNTYTCNIDGTDVKFAGGYDHFGVGATLKRTFHTGVHSKLRI